jgi:hypothetical protein
MQTQKYILLYKNPENPISFNSLERNTSKITTLKISRNHKISPDNPFCIILGRVCIIKKRTVSPTTNLASLNKKTFLQ